MIKIVADKIDVKGVFKKAFMELTKQICNVDLIEREAMTPNNTESFTVTVKTRGVFCAAITCIQDKKLAQAIVKGMMKGRELPADEQKLYIKEYFNIICGNGISKINNEVKSTSRPGLPIFHETIPGQAKDYDKIKDKIRFCSEYGDMYIYVDYRWSA